MLDDDVDGGGDEVCAIGGAACIMSGCSKSRHATVRDRKRIFIA